MKCYICQFEINGNFRKDLKGYAHENCFVARSKLNLKGVNIEQFPLPSGFDKRAKMYPKEISTEEFKKHLEKMRKIIKDNIIGDLND